MISPRIVDAAARALVCRVVLIFLLLCSAGEAATLRCYENPPIPEEILESQGDLARAGYIDVTKPPYHADKGGTHDAAGAIQQAIDHGYRFSLTVYVPKGTYLLERPLVARQLEGFGGCGKSNRKYINVVVGDATGGTYPVLKAADGAFAGKTAVSFVFGQGDGSSGQDASRHYGSVFRGFTIDMGDNPGGTALSMPGAQLCAIEDVEIKGSFDIGIDSLPGSGGSTTNVTIVGGRTGIKQSLYRPTPSIQGLVLRDQSQYGIRLDEARGGLVIAGFEISGSGQAGVLISDQDSPSHPARNLVMVDGSFDMPGTPAIQAAGNSLYLRNVYARAGTIVSNGETGTLAGSAPVWTRVGEYASAGAVADSPLMIDGQDHGTKNAAYQDGLTEVAAPPARLVGLHAWDPARVPTYFNSDPLDLRDYGATPDRHDDDDAPAINRALQDSAAQNRPVFLPRGFFATRSPVDVPLGAAMIGASFGNTVIMAASDWQPSSPTAVLQTEDGVGDVFLMDFAIVAKAPEADDTSANHMHAFHGRASNMLLRDVIPERKQDWRSDAWAQTVGLWSGNAGGRVYNLAMDYHELKGAPAGEHYAFAVRGTRHPLAFYQPNTESISNDPQVLIEQAQNVTWYALKFENVQSDVELLHINDSRNVGVLGGSGNYTLETSMITINDSNDVVVALLARQGEGGQALLEDGETRIPAVSKITTFRKGNPKLFGELDPPDFPYPAD